MMMEIESRTNDAIARLRPATLYPRATRVPGRERARGGSDGAYYLWRCIKQRPVGANWGTVGQACVGAGPEGKSGSLVYFFGLCCLLALPLLSHSFPLSRLRLVLRPFNSQHTPPFSPVSSSLPRFFLSPPFLPLSPVSSSLPRFFLSPQFPPSPPGSSSPFHAFPYLPFTISSLLVFLSLAFPASLFSPTYLSFPCRHRTRPPPSASTASLPLNISPSPSWAPLRLWGFSTSSAWGCEACLLRYSGFGVIKADEGGGGLCGLG
ncbi:hypothetical protein B0H34DRAFT_493760 [Crassisporium funariophilum]|nr:hypothetical protein B0H34DRAFT_493760 [Crassisporium funariophilum]